MTFRQKLTPEIEKVPNQLKSQETILNFENPVINYKSSSNYIGKTVKNQF